GLRGEPHFAGMCKRNYPGTFTSTGYGKSANCSVSSASIVHRLPVCGVGQSPIESPAQGFHSARVRDTYRMPEPLPYISPAFRKWLQATDTVSARCPRAVQELS